MLWALLGPAAVFAHSTADLSLQSASGPAWPSADQQRQVSEDSFLLVDKGQEGTSAALSTPASAASVNGSSASLSEESSGTPAEPTGVPAPRAGWITMIGLFGVVAWRIHSRSRRRPARTFG